MFMRVSSIRGSVQEVGFITITLMGGMKGIGLMRNMMGMELRHGRKGAGIAGSIGWDWGMGLGCIGSTPAMCMLESGLMGSVMGVEFILVRMGASMLGNSSGVLNMGLVVTISGEWLWFSVIG
jgi:hypothetical protein